MKSIKVYLVIAVLSVMTLTIFLAALHGYQSSMAAADALFDRQLKDVSRLLLSTYREAELPTSDAARVLPQVSTAKVLESAVVYQIWSGDGTYLMATNIRLNTAIGEFIEGLGYHNFLNYRWRVNTQLDSTNQRWIMVAERSDLRFLLAENLIAESIWPVVMSLPVAALLIWWFIGSGLSLLKRLATDLQLKQVEDLTPLQYENVPRELVVVVDSINRLFQRLDDAFRRERNFAADAAHELRTPISALKVHVHNLHKSFPAAAASISAIDNDLSRLSHLIEQILLLYRTNPENSVVRLQSIDLTALAQQVVSEMYEDFESRKQSVELFGDAHLQIEGDSSFLGILLRNLLSNANKYAPQAGRIEVEIALEHNYVNLIVMDSGPGIDETEFGRVFDRFYRVGGDRHASGAQGCGLGLAIVKHIADRHRARVRFFRRSRELDSMDADNELFAVCVEFPLPGNS